jgi:TDG/mug DNA glycosylase family protein
MRTAWKPTRAQLDAARDATVADLLMPGLEVLFCGINPSLYSAAIRHHFGRPGNRFWPALHGGGFTSRLLTPFEERELLAQHCGITNLVARATAAADELSDAELQAGARVLERKVRRHRPRCVAFLGVTSYRTAFARPRAGMGLQNERLGASDIWVLPNPSGLNAHYQLADLARLFAELRNAIVEG